MAEQNDFEVRVSLLDNFPLDDDQPDLEGPAWSINVDGYTNFNFADRNAFEAKWVEELATIAKMQEVLDGGEQHIKMVYTYRSCSKALPQVKAAEQENKKEIYEKTFDVLDPEIKKLKDFMYFQKESVKTFCEYVKKLAGVSPEKKAVSETLMWYLIKLLDLFALMDALKNMKACLNNDFSFYKRAVGFLKKNITGNDDQTQENHGLYLFLAHQNSITTNLKSELQAIPQFDDVIAMVVNQCADCLDKEFYLSPAEKHCLLRVMPYGLFLLDGGEGNTNLNLFKNKKVKLERFAKIFKKYPVVPLYGDMQIMLESTIKRSPHYDERLWPSAAEPKNALEYEIVSQLEAARAAYNDYLALYSNMINEIKVMKKDAKDKTYGVSGDHAKFITGTVLQGLKLLADWTAKVLQQSAWKYSKPNTDPQIESIVDYERVVRYNYNEAERFALVEIIAMIKSLAGRMLKEDSLLAPILRRQIHDELQEFVQLSLREMIYNTTKKKRPIKTNSFN